MKKRQSQPPPEIIEPNFIHRFVSRNYERRQIDEQSFLRFNRFVSYIGNSIQSKTTHQQIIALVTSVITVFRNFHELSKSRSTYHFPLQLLDIYMSTLEKIITAGLPHPLAYELMNIFWPLHDPSRRQANFDEIQKKVQKLGLSCEDQTQIIRNQVKIILPDFWTAEKYSDFIALIARQYGEGNTIDYFFKAYLKIQGQKFLDVILKLITFTIEDLNIVAFKNILQIYLSIGINHEILMTHVEALMNKILRSNDKVEFFSLIATQISLEKFYIPNHLLEVSLNIIDTIFVEKLINQESYKTLEIIASYRHLFMKADKVIESQKISNLTINILRLILQGKGGLKKSRRSRQTRSKGKSKGKSSKSIGKNEARSRSKSNNKKKQLQPMLKEYGMLSGIFGEKAETLSELEKLLKLSQSNEEEGDRKSYREESGSDGEDSEQRAKIRESLLSKGQIQKYTKVIHRILDILAFKCKATSPLICQTVRQDKNKAIYTILNSFKNVDPDTERFKFIIDFLMGIFPKLLTNNQNFETLSEETESGVVRLIKLKILQQRKLMKKNANQIFAQIYQPIHKHLMDPKAGQNYHFLILHMAHKYLRQISKKVIRFLIDSMLAPQQSQNVKIHCIGVNLALINSIIEPWSNIKYSISLMKDLVNKLNYKFTITDFMNASQIKENSLFISLQQKEQIDSDKESVDEEQSEIFQGISEMLNSLIQKQSGIKTSKILGEMTENNADKSTFYYMIIIQLNSLCRQYSKLKPNQSPDFEAIVQIKKNNMFGMILTASNEIKKLLKSFNKIYQEKKQFSEQNMEQICVIFHLLKKTEFLINSPQQSANNILKETKLDEDKNGLIVPKRTANIVRNLILDLIYKMSQNISFQLLKLINNNYMGTMNGEQVEMMISQKNTKLKDYIKEMKLIKFYAESVANYELLIFMTAKTGIKLIEFFTKIVDQASKNKKEMEMEQENPLINSQQDFDHKLKTILLLFDYQNEKIKTKQRKLAHIFTAIKILTQSAQTSRKPEQTKACLSILETNHEQFQQILINQAHNRNPEGKQYFYQQKTGFMGYLLDNMFLFKYNDIQDVVKSEKMCLNLQISTYFLNMLKTLIDNNSNILKITQEYLHEKIDTHNKISSLINDRTVFGLQIVEKAIKNMGKGDETNASQEEYMKRQIEEYLKLSKKMYSILSKLLYQAQNENILKINMKDILKNIIQLDSFQSLPASVYISRQILNISVIFKPYIANNLSDYKQISEIIFEHLMRMRETYQGSELQSAIKQKNMSQMIDENAAEINSISINSYINYFIDQFYDFSHKISTQQHKDNEIKLEKPEVKVCQKNKKTLTFKCLACDPDAEICGNCAINCHQDHEIIYIPNQYQLSKNCECKEISECQLLHEPDRNKKDKAMKKQYRNSLQHKMEAEMIRERVMKYNSSGAGYISAYKRNPDNPFEQLPERLIIGSNKYERFGQLNQSRPPPRIREMMPEFIPDQERPSYGMFQREVLQKDRIDKERNRRDREREKIRQIYQRQTFFGFGGDRGVEPYENNFGRNPFEEIEQPDNWKGGLAVEQQDEQQQITEDFEDENYKQKIIEEDKKEVQEKKNTKSLISSNFSPLEEQTYLLSIVLSMLSEEILEKQALEGVNKVEEITWFIKLEQPLKINNALLNTEKPSILKMCPANSFQTKLRKPDGSYHPSPSVSRKSFLISDKFLIFISGLNINVHPKQKLLGYVNEGKNNTTPYQFIHQHQLPYEAHSICCTPQGNICTAGLHNLTIFGLQSQGVIEKHHIAKFSINNDNINKIEVTNIGILVGLSREIKLFGFDLKQIAALKIPENLIKQWCCTPNSEKSYTVYITINDGYIFYQEINPGTEGIINFKKKVNDNRMNRPVGSFVLVKNIKDCGKLIFASFKDKNIGHYLGRLDGSNVMDNNYIKVNSQGIDPFFDANFCMGQTDIIESPNNKNELYMITIFKAQINDSMSVHRGVLTLIKFIKDSKNQITRYEAQFISPDHRCEYFSILKLNDEGEEKGGCGNPYWLIVSLHEDGSLVVTNPFKINESIFKNQIKGLRDKKMQNINKKIMNKMNQNTESPEKKNESEQIRNRIKDQINLKTLVQKAHQLADHQHYSYLQNTQILKVHDDYTIISQEKGKSKVFEIKLKNQNKIITGISLPEQGQVVLNSRRIPNTFDIGFTYEESLFIYAFGSLRFTLNLNQNQKFVRQSLKDQIQSMMNKKRLGENPIEDKMMKQEKQVKKKVEIMIYGENLMSTFKEKVLKSYPEIFSPFSKDQELFSLSAKQKIYLCLKTTNIFLTNALVTKNYDVVTLEEILQFVQIVRENFMKSKKNQEDKFGSKNYKLLKSLVFKALRIYEHLRNIKLHAFNDQYHPLRSSTEIKIDQLYDALNKNQITDQELIFLINQLHDFLAYSQDDFLEDSEPTKILSEKREVLYYYLAKYPAILMKIHKKLRVIELAGITEKLIPLYILGYEIQRFIKYHTQWMLPALCEVTGKETIVEGLSKSKYQCRKNLYKYLKEYQDIKLEAWLKNIDPIDAKQCMKQAPPVQVRNPPPSQNFDFMMMQELGEGDDFEAQIKMALQLSKMEMRAQGEQDLGVLMQEQNLEMEEPQNIKDEDNVQIILKDLVHECLKDVDFNANSIEANTHKVIVLYVVSKITEENHCSKDQDMSLLILFRQIKNVMKKITQNYQPAGNSNIHNILMLWMDLFGFIFKKSQSLLLKQEGDEFAEYSQIKDEIMDVLKHKIRVEQIKKYHVLPKMVARLFKGKKLATKAPLVYGLIKVLQPPCEINYALLTLECYWLFPENREYYNKTKYTDTIRENQKLGNMEKIYDTAMTNVQLWQEIGDPEWLMDWIQNKNNEWPKALKLLALIYEDKQ